MDIRIIGANSEHRADIVRLLRHTFTTSGSEKSSDSAAIFDQIDLLTDDCLSERNSLIAMHPIYGVIGCNLNKFAPIDQWKMPPAMINRLDNVDDTIRCLLETYYRLTGGFFQELLRNGHFVAWHILDCCVDERHSESGVAERLVQESLRLARRFRTDFAFSIVTHHTFQHMLAQSGFKTWRRLSYDEIFDDDGIAHFSTTDGVEELKLMWKSFDIPIAG